MTPKKNYPTGGFLSFRIPRFILSFRTEHQQEGLRPCSAFGYKGEGSASGRVDPCFFGRGGTFNHTFGEPTCNLGASACAIFGRGAKNARFPNLVCSSIRSEFHADPQVKESPHDFRS